jgi:hypothetical protein
MIKNKGDNEIISQALIILIVTITVGLIITVLLPFIGEMQSKIRYENSVKQLDILDQKISEIINAPIGTTKEIYLNLTQLHLSIDNNKIEIYSITNNNSSFFKDGLRIDEGNKYSYREGQKIVVGISYPSISFGGSISLENINNVNLIIKKTNKNYLSISQENITSSQWYSSSRNIYSQDQGNYEFRKLLLINYSKVEGDLKNFPVLIHLEDEDLKNYAKNDGSDIMFTLGDGVTKLNREIESFFQTKYFYKKIIIDSSKVEEDLIDFKMLFSTSDEDLIEYSRNDGKDIYFTLLDKETKIDHEIEYFNKENGKLITWIKIPFISKTNNTEIYMFFGDQIYINTENIWNENYLLVQHLNDTPSNGLVNGFIDSSIYSNHGTATGFYNNEYSNTDYNGVIDGAIILDVNNNYINLNNTINLKKSDKFVISGWIQRKESDLETYDELSENIITQKGWGSWAIVTDDSNISFVFDDDVKRCETEINTNEFVNFVFVNDVDDDVGYGSNRLLLYINGELVNNCPTIDE